LQECPGSGGRCERTRRVGPHGAGVSHRRTGRRGVPVIKVVGDRRGHGAATPRNAAPGHSRASPPWCSTCWPSPSSTPPRWACWWAGSSGAVSWEASCTWSWPTPGSEDLRDNRVGQGVSSCHRAGRSGGAMSGEGDRWRPTRWRRRLCRLDLSRPGDLVVLARLVASAISTRVGFDIEELEDLRLAVGELCLLALAGSDARHGICGWSSPFHPKHSTSRAP